MLKNVHTETTVAKFVQRMNERPTDISLLSQIEHSPVKTLLTS